MSDFAKNGKSRQTRLIVCGLIVHEAGIMHRMKKNPVLIALGKNGSELREVQFSSHRHAFGNGGYYDLRETLDGGLTIDRLFVPEGLRGRGLHKKNVVVTC